MKTQFTVLIAAVIFAYTHAGFAQQPEVQFYRPYNQDGAGIFEPTKQDTIIYNGVKVRVGGAFAQQFQMLDHSTSFISDEPTGQLVELRDGFNNATANFNIDVQLDDGIRLELITYLSARHHQEAWVKGGYIQFDKFPFLNSAGVDKIMEHLTLKIGHMEVNYGDAHFRRTDNGNAIYNPFVGNYIMDAFNTEIGAEAYVQASGFIGMLGVTEGEIKGDVKAGAIKKPSVIGKIGYDGQINEDLRLRLTGSVYTTKESSRNYLYAGDRAGSRYYYVLEPLKYIDYRAGGAVTSTSAVNRPTSGRWNPDLSNSITAVMINPFVKFKGLEFFGIYEIAQGASDNDVADRKVTQFGGEVLYRFLKNENIYLGARYNKVGGELSSSLADADITRMQLAAGWFINKNILAKLEYVKQNYNGFSGNIYENGQFDGVMIEAVIGF